MVRLGVKDAIIHTIDTNSSKLTSLCEQQILHTTCQLSCNQTNGWIGVHFMVTPIIYLWILVVKSAAHSFHPSTEFLSCSKYCSVCRNWNMYKCEHTLLVLTPWEQSYTEWAHTLLVTCTIQPSNRYMCVCVHMCITSGDEPFIPQFEPIILLRLPPKYTDYSSKLADYSQQFYNNSSIVC